LSFLINPYWFVSAAAELIWESVETGEEEGLWSGGSTRGGELFETGHVCIDSVPTKFTFNLRKTDDPTGTATLNLLDENDNVKATFPLESTGVPLVVSTLTESFASYNFVNDSNTFPILDGYRVVFYYSGDQYFRFQVCGSCSEDDTEATIYTAPNWQNRTLVCTMKVYGTPA